MIRSENLDRVSSRPETPTRRRRSLGGLFGKVQSIRSRSPRPENDETASRDNDSACKSPKTEKNHVSLSAVLGKVKTPNFENDDYSNASRSVRSVGKSPNRSRRRLSLGSKKTQRRDDEMSTSGKSKDSEDSSREFKMRKAKKKMKSARTSRNFDDRDNGSSDGIEFDAPLEDWQFDAPFEECENRKSGKKKKRSKKRSSSRTSKKKSSEFEKDRSYDSDGALGEAKAKARAARRAAKATERERQMKLEDKQSSLVEDTFGSPRGTDEYEKTGYSSDGILGDARSKAKAARALRRQEKHLDSSTHPDEERRQEILKDLDAFDDRESVTIMYLQKQIDALKQQVQTVESEKDGIQKQLVEEIERNDDLSQQVRKARVNWNTPEEEMHVDTLKARHRREQVEWEATIREKDACIDELKSSINSLLVNDGTAPMLEGDQAQLSVLEEALELQKIKINELTLKLMEENQNSAVEKRFTAQLKEELFNVNLEKSALKNELENVKNEYKLSLKKRDDTVAYYESEMARIQTAPASQSLSQMPLNPAAKFSLTDMLSPFG